MAHAKDVLFRVFYSTSFTLVFLLLIVFICASPVDIIYQSWRRRRLMDIFLISGTYIVTGLIAALIYSSRLYTNRSVLKEIPKLYIPVDKDDLPNKRTWRFVSQMLARSAIIAHQAKPRSKRVENESDGAKDRIAAALKPDSSKGPQPTQIIRDWHGIQHPGFSSPAASSLANLEYAVVIAELTGLIEAKAVSLAPIDPMSVSGPDSEPLPDARIIDVLIRPGSAGARGYLSQLVALGVIANTEVASEFLSHYERARFAPQPVSEPEFQALMQIFAELLRNMRQVDPDLLDLHDFSQAGDDRSYEGNEISNVETEQVAAKNSRSLSSMWEGRPETSTSSPRVQSARQAGLSAVSLPGSVASTSSDAGSVVHNRPAHNPPSRVSEDSVPSQATEEEDEEEPRSSKAQSRRDTITVSSRRSSRRSHNPVDNPHANRPQNISSTSAVRASTTPNPASQSGTRPLLQQAHSQNSVMSGRSGLSARSGRSGRSGLTSRSGRSGNSNTGSVIVRLATPEERDARGPGGLPYTIEMP